MNLNASRARGTALFGALTLMCRSAAGAGAISAETPTVKSLTLTLLRVSSGSLGLRGLAGKNRRRL